MRNWRLRIGASTPNLQFLTPIFLGCQIGIAPQDGFIFSEQVFLLFGRDSRLLSAFADTGAECGQEFFPFVAKNMEGRLRPYDLE